MRYACSISMQGYLRKNEFRRWEIVNDLGERLELTSGDVIELENVLMNGKREWVTTRIESQPEPFPPFKMGYYAVDGAVLYNGKNARYIGR